MSKILKEEILRIKEIMKIPLNEDKLSGGKPWYVQLIDDFVSARPGRFTQLAIDELNAIKDRIRNSTTTLEFDNELKNLFGRGTPWYDELKNYVRAAHGPTILRMEQDAELFGRNLIQQGYSLTDTMDEVDKFLKQSTRGYLGDDIAEEILQKVRPNLYNLTQLNNFAPLADLTGTNLINFLRAKFAGNRAAQKAISRAEKTIKNFDFKGNRELYNSILRTQEDLIRQTLLKGKPDSWWKWLLNEVKNNWATKAVIGFMIACLVTYIFAVFMIIAGANVTTPLCNLLVGFLAKWGYDLCGNVEDYIENNPNFNPGDFSNPDDEMVPIPVPSN